MTSEPGLTVKQSKNGKGVFTTKVFAPRERLLVVKGKKITCYEDDDLSETVRNNAFRFDEERYISPEGHVGAFINHSCEPNARIVKRGQKLEVHALHLIAKGEEVTFDYSTVIAKDDIWQMKHCNCQSATCRGTVKPFHRLPTALKKRYIEEEIVPKHILEV